MFEIILQVIYFENLWYENTVPQLLADVYYGVEQRISYHKTETEQLLNLYHLERLQDQLATESTQYGVLTVRAYFHHDSLCVEVLNARDVIPLDPNGNT